MADEEWLPFMKAADIVSRARKVTFVEAEAQLTAAIKRGELHTEIDQQLAAVIKSYADSLPNKRSTDEPWSGLDILRESAMQGSLARVLAEHPLINKADLERCLHQSTPEKGDDASKAKAEPVTTQPKPVARPSKQATKLRTQPKQDPIKEALKALYPPDGKPNQNLSPKILMQRVEVKLAEQGRQDVRVTRDSLSRALGRRK
jgi:hypothetical protein